MLQGEVLQLVLQALHREVPEALQGLALEVLEVALAALELALEALELEALQGLALETLALEGLEVEALAMEALQGLALEVREPCSSGGFSSVAAPPTAPGTLQAGFSQGILQPRSATPPA